LLRRSSRFELKFIRPGQQYIQVAPFWLAAKAAPQKTSTTLSTKAGRTINGIKLMAAEDKTN
jgi:hypothetical protein